MADRFISAIDFKSRALVIARGSPSWTRLEPQSVTGDPRPGLEARVHDPLWLLCRQWQLGELEGDDAGSPLGVEISASTGSLSRWQAGDWKAEDPKPVFDLPDGRLLEPIVEDEPGAAAGPGLRQRAEAGGVFLAALDEDAREELHDAVLAHAGLEDPGPRSARPLATRPGPAALGPGRRRAASRGGSRRGGRPASRPARLARPRGSREAGAGRQGCCRLARVVPGGRAVARP